MMKLKVTLFGVLTAVSLGLVAPYASAAEPITIFGINWTMEPMKDAVEKLGYEKCSEVGVIRKVGQLRVLVSQWIYCKGGKEINFVEGEYVGFNCEVYNGWFHDNSEIAKALYQSGFTHFGRWTKFGGKSRICKVGEAGDEICFEPQGKRFTLIKRAPNIGPMTFN